MKKNFWIRNIIIGIVVIVLALGVTYYLINKNARKYEIEKIENYNYFVLKHDNLSGVIDKTGKIIIESKYDDVKVPNPEKGIFICFESDNTKVLNDKAQEIFSEYKNIEPISLKSIASDLLYEKSVLKYSENDKFGLVNFEGEKITSAIYDEIDGFPYKEGELLVKQNEKYGVINIKGNILVDIKYDKIDCDGYYTSENGYKDAGYVVSNKTDEGYRYGYINIEGNTVLKVEYNQLNRISQISDKENSYFIEAKNGQFGLMKNNEEVINNEYQSITYDESNKLLLIEKSKKYGVASIEGNIIVPAEFNQIDITGVYIYAKNSQGTVIYNTNGTEANIDANIAILNTSNEKYKIRINNENGTKYGVIGKDGKQIIEEKYNYIEYLYDNYFIVSNKESKLGIIDDKENVKVEIENDSIQRVNETDIMQVTKSNEKITSLYSRNMEKLCEIKNANILFQDEFIIVSSDVEQKYFNKLGNEVDKTEVYSSNTLFSKNVDGKWGFSDKNGNIVVDAKYDKVTEFNKYGFAGVKKDEKWGAIDTNGKEVIEPVYTLNENQEPFFIGEYYQVKFGFGEVYFTDNKN